MPDERSNQKGGFHIGRVGGNMQVTAGGDIVAGDKVTTTTIQKGFRGEEQKQQFQAQIDLLREALRAVREEIKSSADITDDQKEEAEAEILQHVRVLKEVKEKSADIPAGREAPPEIASTVESALNRAGSVMERLQTLATKSVGIAEAVGRFAAKFGPLVITARQLFGLS